MRYLSIFFFVITAMLTSCSSNTDTAKVEELYKTLKFDNNKIEYMGRIGETDSTSELYWSGSSIKVEFEGTEISATLQDEKGDNYFNKLIDKVENDPKNSSLTRKQKDDLIVKRVTKKVNGGYRALAERQKLFQKIKKEMKL